MVFTMHTDEYRHVQKTTLVTATKYSQLSAITVFINNSILIAF